MTKKKENKLVRAARLDETGIYQGIDEVPEGELTDRHLPQIADCDLRPGHYRWLADPANPYGGHFTPLPPKSAEAKVKEPDTLRAIALGFAAFHNAGLPLPAETVEWLQWYSASADVKGV